MLVVDTDVLIDIQRGYPPAVEWFKSLSEIPTVTGFTVMELTQDARNRDEVGKAFKLVGGLPFVWPADVDSNRALECFAQFHVSHGLGLLDALIAFTALGLGAPLCTHNQKHFRAVPGLLLEKPYPRP